MQASTSYESMSINEKLDLLVQRHIMGKRQAAAVLKLAEGEERKFFADKLAELLHAAEKVPKLGEQDGKEPEDGSENEEPGDAAVVHLHYFGGSCDFYIYELDQATGEAFGLADLYGDGGELGTIILTEDKGYGVFGIDIPVAVGPIKGNAHIELDFHFTPKTLKEVRAQRRARGIG